MHLWGMTETSPIGTAGYRPWNWDQLSFDEQVDIKSRQGRAPFGVELRCVDLDDPAKILPRDGTTSGALQIRGPWIVKRYFKAEMDAAPDPENWFNTGDVAGSPISLCVCKLSRQRGCLRQYCAAAAVLAARSGPSIGCRK